MFVTGAAGAVGTMAGQIARLLGAARVIGGTGSPQKARRLERELGYDATVLRGARFLGRQLAQATPDCIDVVLDTVGGELLTAAVSAANRGARIALVGALDGQLSPDRAGGSAPAVLDTYRLLTRGITIAGFNGVDHPDVEAEWETRFGHWLRAGDIHFPYTPVVGMERTPGALPGLIAGRSFGASILELYDGTGADMRIGEAAAAAGTTPRALCLYEARGLLPPPPRTSSGQREYGFAEVARVRVIRSLLGLGLTLQDIRRLALRKPPDRRRW
ncbi:zinc-binding dehydrogenase [Streptomyces sp. NPDC055721]|uniref:zinc-binding dehydrogenase n=1 Tax=Streptomyces sp. NPDC127132 TaxID=3345374 RepID=UPI00363C780F